MIELSGHTLATYSEQELIRRGYRLAKRSARLLPLAITDLIEGQEVYIDNHWYEIFMVDPYNDCFYLEPGGPNGS